MQWSWCDGGTCSDPVPDVAAADVEAEHHGDAEPHDGPGALLRAGQEAAPAAGARPGGHHTHAGTLAQPRLAPARYPLPPTLPPPPPSLCLSASGQRDTSGLFYRTKEFRNFLYSFEYCMNQAWTWRLATATY